MSAWHAGLKLLWTTCLSVYMATQIRRELIQNQLDQVHPFVEGSAGASVRLGHALV
jgi:hypothetical protein